MIRFNLTIRSIVIAAWVFLLTGCSKPAETLFELLPSGRTGIYFNNAIAETDSFNILTHEYIYNGGGVAIADFNNDTLQDIFFTGNEVPNRLYLNKGDMRFEDITQQAGVNVAGRWNSGVVVVDINNDGWQDLYVCATMKEDTAGRTNMLFLNKGVNEDNVPVFEEAAYRYGIADTGYSMMAAFFDYDRDGDLDLYVLTNQYVGNVQSNYRPKIVDGSSPNNDRLYRNNGDETFTNITKEAGIVYEGYGLGLAIADVNVDGWPDIYVSNDYISNDVLYINNQDGTFSNRASQWIGHQSQFSMGNDAADFNNDGLPDIITLDMLPETNSRKKTTINNKSYLNYINNEKYNYEYQYIRNMLHVNNGTFQDGAFSEIGQLAGVHQTEWSWSPLMADFDNDGNKDLLITNGFPKDITDKDFSNYRNDVGPFVKLSDLVDSIPVVKIPNYAFRNKGDLTFEDVCEAWGITQPSFSNGAAFADLDNDGDLDYIVNNINDEAFIYKNTLNDAKSAKGRNHYARFKLAGSGLNKQTIGSKISLYYDSGKLQYAEHEVARGYLSSVENITHFGLGSTSAVDSVVVIWPDGNTQKITDVSVDKVVTITYNPDLFVSPRIPLPKQHLFREVSEQVSLLFAHEEEDRIDFNLQRTLPHKFSQAGPGISVGDFTGDGLDDLIFGGSTGNYFTAFVQQKDGSFSEMEMTSAVSKMSEDEGLLLFDADNDGDLDLYIVSGGIESEPGTEDYRDRFYRNMGNGKFVTDPSALPDLRSSGSCVRASDIDADGDLDLFVGGRVVPGSYPYPAESYILRNDNGAFKDITAEVCPELKNLGMITDAIFTDFDSDGKIDIAITGEFMPVTFLKNDGKRFSVLASTGVETLSGWWNSIAGGDFDNDGDIDYIVGNLGLNNCYQADAQYPLVVYAKDFDNNGSVDPILACYSKESLQDNKEKKLFPVHFWDEMNSQSPKFRQQFSRYRHFGTTTMKSLFSEEELKDALILQANYFRSAYIRNDGNGKFQMTELPVEAQFGPVNGIVTDDVNSDGNLDVIVVGNDFGNEVFSGRYDALTGLVLTGDGKGNFQAAVSSETGFLVAGDVKSLARVVNAKGENLFVASRNRNTAKAFVKIGTGSIRVIALESSDAWAEFTYDDGRKSRIEFYHGSGYLSQSTRKVIVNPHVKEIVMYDYKGRSRKVHEGDLAAK